MPHHGHFTPEKETWGTHCTGVCVGLGFQSRPLGKISPTPEFEPQTIQPIASHAVGMLRIISEQTLDIDEELCTCFTDWQRAFDDVNRLNQLNAYPKGN
jgi:hypothetical protein